MTERMTASLIDLQGAGGPGLGQNFVVCDSFRGERVYACDVEGGGGEIGVGGGEDGGGFEVCGEFLTALCLGLEKKGEVSQKDSEREISS
jgi:hypothetical protein